jgi:hypothetical protein
VRVFGFWLLYATVGLLVMVMAVGGAGGDLGSEDSSSPTRFRTKLVGALSGVWIGLALLGYYLLSAPAGRAAAIAIFFLGLALAIGFVIWAWIWIADDLKKRGD